MKTIRRKTSNDMDQYCELLENEGYKFAGSGMYGKVYVKDDHAVKVGCIDDNKPYLDYVRKCCAASQNNPWVPEIYELVMYNSKAGENFFVVTMEKLQPLYEGAGSEWSDIPDDHPNAELFAKVERVLQFHESEPRWRSAWDVSNHQEAVRFLSKKVGKQSVKKLETFAVKLAKVADANNHCFDIHDGNVMVRSTGQLVITDPVC